MTVALFIATAVPFVQPRLQPAHRGGLAGTPRAIDGDGERATGVLMPEDVEDRGEPGFQREQVAVGDVLGFPGAIPLLPILRRVIGEDSDLRWAMEER